MKVISVSSGKGGVGKTSLVCNLSLALSKQGHRVLILDGDLGMANVDIFFGVHPQKTIQDLIEGLPFKDCLTSVAQNIDLLAGGSGLYQLGQLNAFQRREVLARVAEFNYVYDYMIIDTAPGLHDHVLHLNSVADECLVLLTPDPSSFTDAYALIKVLHQRYKSQKFSIVCNQVVDDKAGAQLYLRFSEVVQQFLPVRLNYKKTIPFDPQMRLSNQLQRLVLRQDSRSVSAQAILNLAADLAPHLNEAQPQLDFTKAFGQLFRPASGHA